MHRGGHTKEERKNRDMVGSETDPRDCKQEGGRDTVGMERGDRRLSS